MVPDMVITEGFLFYSSRRKAGRDSFGMEQLLKDYLGRYGKVMDERDESKGMNNFKGTVDKLLAGKNIGNPFGIRMEGREGFSP